MARLETFIDAPTSAVWAVLNDGYRYADWVIGTQKIRGVDPGWPHPGTNLHFTAGIGPIQHDDTTTVLAYDPQERLELEAKAWPLGTARIELRVREEPGGTRLSFDEHPLRGPAGMVHNPVLDALLWVRGRLMMRKLTNLVREQAAASAR